MRRLYYIDLFSGAGGTTQGVEQGMYHRQGISKVVACVNHWDEAIKSHELNHPDCLHFTEDVRTLDMTPLIELVSRIRAMDPFAAIVVWASLECTHFSAARGKAKMDESSRTLAHSLYRYIEALDPDLVQIENVKEFLTWGPIDEQGRPIKKYKERDYKEWVSKVTGYGYSYEYRILNAADFGVPQSRKRLFIQFSKPDIPITWPEPTHSPENHEPVRKYLDIHKRGDNIFDKGFSERTLRRIYRGLQKHYKDAGFMVQYYTSGENHKSLDEPSGTVATKDRFRYVNVDTHFMGRNDRTGDYVSLDKPCGTVLTVPKQKLITVVQFLYDDSYDNKGRSVDLPAGTIIARQDKKPLKLLTSVHGVPPVDILDTDSPYTKKIKQFMNEHGIRSVHSRLLSVEELLRIQSFPDTYRFAVKATKSKEMIGNAVPPKVAQAITEATHKALLQVGFTNNKNLIPSIL